MVLALSMGPEHPNKNCILFFKLKKPKKPGHIFFQGLHINSQSSNSKEPLNKFCTSASYLKQVLF